MRSALLSGLVAIALAPPTAAQPAAAEIVERALETAEAARKRGLETRYRYRHVNRTQPFGLSGDPKKPIHDVYSVYPRNGEPFYELVWTDGRPATAKDLAREAELRAKFRETVNTDEDFERDSRRGFAFDRELVERYKLSLAGRETLDGRPTWVVEFEPRGDDLDVERRVDYALNSSSGRFWIDAGDYGLARIDFELQEPVGVWGGLLGSITRFEGVYRQRRLEPGGWLPESLELEMDGRALFESLARRVSLEWTDYRPVEEVEAGL